MSGEQTPDYDDDSDNADCWNCGGEGYVSSCFEEYACVDPEDGCDLCTRRCDVCRPRKTILADLAAAEAYETRHTLEVLGRDPGLKQLSEGENNV